MAVLVAYGTSRGSTRGIAERLAAGLARHGIAADVRPVEDHPDLAGYSAVILGSAIHDGKWLPQAREFAAANAQSLSNRPLWLFSVSTVGDEESMFAPRPARRLRAMRGETPELAALRSRLQPRAHRNFAGAIARSDWPLRGRVFFRVMGGRYGDHRNWPAIDAWADEIAAGL